MPGTLDFKDAPFIRSPIDYELDTNTGPMVNIMFDYILINHLSVGGILSYGYTSAKRLTVPGAPITFDIPYNMHLCSIGAVVKGRLNVNNVIQIRPGLIVGYQVSIREYSGESDVYNGLNVSYLLEIAYHLGNGHVLVGEIGLASQPVGSDIEEGSTKVTWDPILFFNIGYEF